MQSNSLPRAAAAIAAIALSFAAGVKSVTLYASGSERSAHEAIVSELASAPASDYFPHRFENQAQEIEPLPPQF